MGVPPAGQPHPPLQVHAVPPPPAQLSREGQQHIWLCRCLGHSCCRSCHPAGPAMSRAAQPAAALSTAAGRASATSRRTVCSRQRGKCFAQRGGPLPLLRRRQHLAQAEQARLVQELDAAALHVLPIAQAVQFVQLPGEGGLRGVVCGFNTAIQAAGQRRGS